MQLRTSLLLMMTAVIVAIILITGHPDNKPDPVSQRTQQSFTMENFDFKRFDAEGQVKYRLVSQHVEQDAATGESIISSPNTWLYKAGKPAWKMTADSGWLNGPQTQARLNDNVVIIEVPDPGVRVTTSELTVNLSEEQAENDKPVKITMANNQLLGTGLFADFSRQKLKLKADVKGNYVP